MNPKKGLISDELLDFKLWCAGKPSRQESFAEYVLGILPQDRKISILEVGGRNGRVSQLLAKHGYQVSCMDPLLETEDEWLEGIEAGRETFEFGKTDLSSYDWVVAQEPCEATEHIVRACTKQGMPYIIALCGVQHRLISGEIPENIFDWYDYLRNIDKEHAVLEYEPLYYFNKVAILRSGS